MIRRRARHPRANECCEVTSTRQAVSNKSVATFHDRDLYPFIYDMKGTYVAPGARPALIGKNLIDLKDQDGKYL